MKKLHYYYKILAISDVGEELQKFMHRCQEAEQKALDWAKKHGAEHYYESPEGMAGGVGAVEFADTTERDGWEMNDLPVVSEAELFGILNLQPNRTKDNLPLPMTFGNSTPVVFLHQGYWYADVPYVSADMTLTKIEEKEFYRRKMAAINGRNVI